MQPFGGIKMSESALKAYGYEIDKEIKEIFTKYRKTHNQGVFDAYTPEMRKARHCAIITGLPDAYGRGRIIGDYRRVALYGIDRLIIDKQEVLAALDGTMTDAKIRSREEIAEQLKALKDMKKMAEIYGYTVISPLTVMLTHLSETIKKHASELLNRAETLQLIENLKKTEPDLVNDVVPNVLSYASLEKLLKNLLLELICTLLMKDG